VTTVTRPFFFLLYSVSKGVCSGEKKPNDDEKDSQTDVKDTRAVRPKVDTKYRARRLFMNNPQFMTAPAIENTPPEAG
jgi:hypothetical protein